MPLMISNNLRPGMTGLACALLVAANTAVADEPLFLVDVPGILDIAREEVYAANQELPDGDLYIDGGVSITCPPPSRDSELNADDETPGACVLNVVFRLQSTVREIRRLDPTGGCVPGEAFETVSVQLNYDGSVESMSRSRCMHVFERFSQCTGGPEPAGLEKEYGPCPD